MTTGVPRANRVLTRQTAPAEGLCLIAVNGAACPNPTRWRGVCTSHFQRLRQEGRLDQLALPSKQSAKHVFAVKDDLEPGLCRLIVNGSPCDRPGNRRGLCARHYVGIWQRPDLDLDDFCTPPLPLRVALRMDTSADRCRVEEAGVGCGDRPLARGLCRHHYNVLRPHPEVFDRVATEKPPAAALTLRSRPREGRCRVAENGVGCGEQAVVRGLCQRHAGALRRQPEAMAAIALPPSPKVRLGFQKAPDAGDAPLTCVVVENGVRCSVSPERRGLCGRHHRILGSHPDYSLHDFYLAERTSVLGQKPPEEIADGLCVVLEDGVPCMRRPHARGLCKGHYHRVVDAGRLEELALPARARGRGFGAGNDRPHVYLDKNVLYDHADHEVFGAGGQEGSVLLVEGIRAGRVRGSVSLDGVKSVYSHVRYRMQRPVEEGGRGAGEAEADAHARAYVEATFYGGGAWRFVTLDPSSFGRVVAAKDRKLSLEDALEFQAYQQTRTGKAGPTMFVTRDTDFPEGVHPTHLAKTLPGASPRRGRVPGAGRGG